jgi:N6-L-threonylcarbamoyladenine synthase
VPVLAAIETSFDETGLALCDAAGRIRQSLLTSQAATHAPYRGVVPELAARTHLSDLPQLWRQLDPGLRRQISAIGVTAAPGLPGSLLAGISFARGLALACGCPLYPLDHLHGHIFSPFMPVAPPAGAPQQDAAEIMAAIPFPHLALIISGGHTELFLVRSVGEIEILGATLDDAVGELLDKVSALLGLGYPGGAQLELLARGSGALDAEARYHGPWTLPVPMRGSGDLNFSYSGLKTAVVRAVRSAGQSSAPLDPPAQADLVAALFSVICDSLWLKLSTALELYGLRTFTVSGGVAINGFIRTRLALEAQRSGYRAHFPQPRHCLDNAEMMAWLLCLRLLALVPEHDGFPLWGPGRGAGKVEAAARR